MKASGAIVLFLSLIGLSATAQAILRVQTEPITEDGQLFQYTFRSTLPAGDNLFLVRLLGDYSPDDLNETATIRFDIAGGTLTLVNGYGISSGFDFGIASNSIEGLRRRSYSVGPTDESETLWNQGWEFNVTPELWDSVTADGLFRVSVQNAPGVSGELGGEVGVGFSSRTVPEPATVGLMIAGLLGVRLLRHRRESRLV